MPSAFKHIVLALISWSAMHAQNDLPSRIRRVETGLFGGVPVRGDTGWTIQERMSHYRIPGVSIAVINNFSVEWTRSYGGPNSEPITEGTLFQAGSISKPLTAVAALIEAEKGKLSIDTSINRYLKTWKLDQRGFRHQPTIGRILSHTAGISVHGFPGYPAGFPLPSIIQTLDGIAPANNDPIKIIIEPGSEFRYSGGGFTILQLALTDILGKSFPDFMRETVLGPAGMSSSTYEQPPGEQFRSRTASGHDLNGGIVEGRYNTYPEMAAAGLWTTPGDLARFLIEIQRAYTGRTNSLLTQESARRMLTPQPGAPTGLGFFLEQRGKDLYFSHNGSNDGYVADMIAHAEKGYGAVVMVNSDNWHLNEEIIASIAREYKWESYLPPEYTIKADSVTEDKKGYAGRFAVSADRIVITHGEGKNLFLQIPPLPGVQLYPIGRDLFVRRDQDVRYEFMRGAGGPVESLKTYSFGGRGRVFRRAADSAFVPSELLAAGKFDDAVAAYKKLLQADTNSGLVSRERFIGMGYNLIAEGKFAEAVDVFRADAELHPALWNVFDDLGEAYRLAGNRPKSLEAYEKSLRLNPRNTRALIMLRTLR